jgi:hypothetical protein
LKGIKSLRMSLKQTVNLENQLRAQLKKKLKLITKLAEKWKIRKLETKMKKMEKSIMFVWFVFNL